MKATGCEFCMLSAGENGAAVGTSLLTVVLIIFVVIPALKRNRQLKELFAVLARVVPCLLGDIQVRTRATARTQPFYWQHGASSNHLCCRRSSLASCRCSVP